MADKSFAEYVQDVMAALPTVNRGLMTGTVSADADKYREDPLWRSRAIKAAAEEEAKKKAALDEALPSTPEYAGGNSGDQSVNPYVAAFLENETPQENADRMANVLGFAPQALAALGLGIPTMGGNYSAGGLLGQGLGRFAQEQAIANQANQSKLGKMLFEATRGYSPDNFAGMLDTAYGYTPASDVSVADKNYGTDAQAAGADAPTYGGYGYSGGYTGVY